MWYQNKTVLKGLVAADLELQPTANGGQRCYFDIKIERAGCKKIEYIPITLWDEHAVQFVQNFKRGDNILVEGELRRNKNDGKKYLAISCDDVRLISKPPVRAEYLNQTILQGFISSDLKLQPTAKSGQRCYFDIKIERAGCKKIEYIPITLWDEHAVQFVDKFKKGDNILVEGELVRTSTADGRKYLGIDCGKVRLVVAAGKKAN